MVASPEEVEPAPAPTISAPAVIGSCDNLTLVAQPQASGLSYTWSAASGDGGDGEPAFTKKLVGASGSRVVVPSHLFPSAGLFTFFLHATDARGYTGPVASLTLSARRGRCRRWRSNCPQSRSRRRRSPPAPPPPPPRAPSPSSASPSRGRSPSPAAARPSRCPAAIRSVRIPANTLPAGEASVLLLTVTALQDGELLSVSSQATITPPLEPLVAAVAGGSQRSAAISERLVLDGSPSRDPSQKGDLSFSWVCVEASGAAAAASDDPCASVLRAIDTDVAALVLPKFWR